MKIFSIASILLALVSGFVPAYAAPLPSSALEARSPIARITSKKFIELMTHKPAVVNRLPVLFNSGCTGDASTIAFMKNKKHFDLLKKGECHTIHNILRDYNAKADWTSLEEWGNVCEVLAGTVNQTPFVLLGEDIKDESVWVKREKPALLKNKDVKDINLWKLVDQTTAENVGIFDKHKLPDLKKK